MCVSCFNRSCQSQLSSSMAFNGMIVQVVFICTISFIFTDATKWCVPETAGVDCKSSLDKDGLIKCVSAPNTFRCMQMLKAGTADVLYVSDTELYPAGQIGLIPLLQIVHNNSNDYRYKAVAVVRLAGKVKKLADLKDAKSCHTGAGKTTGWTVPVSNLIKMKIISPLKDCYSSVDNVGNFFAQSCVPGAMTDRYNPLKLNPPRLCSLCKDKTDLCSVTDLFKGYDGAKRCLEENKADIAFVKHETMLGENKKTYKLLCPNDKLMDLDKYDDCNWAVRPSDTIVVSPKVSNPSEIAELIIKNTDDIKKKLEWKNVNELQKTDKDYSEIMGEGFKNTFEYYHTCKNSLRWCAISDAEMNKCTDLKLAFMAKRATNKLECVKAKDHHECISMIEQKKADFVVLDGGDLDVAMNNCKLKPVIAESYGIETASYYTVVVVKSSATFNIEQLKGKRSCHTGIDKTSGWKSPISYLLENKMLPKGNTIPERVGKFFNASCVPGALDPKYDPEDTNPESLCALCPKSSKCVRNPDNKYYGYTGALRCLVEAPADVAFVKHSTVESTVGIEDWAKNLSLSDFKLLCKNGSTASVKDWRSCYIYKVPAHAMVIRNDDYALDQQLFQIFSNFDLKSQESKDLLFKCHGGTNCLFKGSTKELIHILDPKKFLGEGYRKILEIFPKKSNLCSGSSHSTISVILVLFTLVNYFA